MKKTKCILNEQTPINFNTSVTEEESKLKTENADFKIKVFPSQISEEDIQSLFLGLVRVVKKKFELDSRAEIINLNLNVENLVKQLHEKQAECNRLKNEIIFLKSQINS